jgi:hypothetical protein
MSLPTLSPQDILKYGFHFMSGLRYNGKWTPRRTDEFKAHYGSSPIVLANQWYDLMTSAIPDLAKTEVDNSEKGLRSFFTAHHFMWAYPKNAKILASSFAVCEKRVQGENLWRWVRMIAALKSKKIVWPEEEYNDPTRQIFIVSVDGTDFKVWERKHPKFPYDKGQYSHKFNHGALKYEIAMDIYRSKVVWISGPHRGGMHDKSIFVDMGLKDKIPVGKLVVSDRVYGNKKIPGDHAKMSLPNAQDDRELANFKARIRARHETFNGRLKAYKSLSDTFHHNPDHHKHLFLAICVTVQYQMDNGGKMFAA